MLGRSSIARWIGCVLLLAGCGGPTAPVAKQDSPAPSAPAKVETAPAKVEPGPTTPPATPASPSVAPTSPVRPTAPQVTQAAREAARYVRKATWLVVHVDVQRLLKSSILTELKPEHLPDRNGPVDLQALAKEAPRWESLTLFVGPPDPQFSLPVSALAVLRTPEDRAEYLKLLGHSASVLALDPPKPSEVEHAGGKYTRQTGPDGSHVCQILIGERGLYLGSEAAAREVLESQGKSGNPALSQLVEQMAERGQVAAAIQAEPARELLTQGATELAAELPALAEAPGWTKTAAAALDLDGPTLLDAEIEATNTDTAANWLGLIRSLWSRLAGGLAGMKPVVAKHPAEHPLHEVLAIGTDLTLFQANQAGTKVTLKIPRPKQLGRLPAIATALHRERAVEFEREMARQLGLAVLRGLGEANNPKLTVNAADGKPLLGWRFRLLPYLDRTDIYQTMKRDEPWDSEHNLELAKEVARLKIFDNQFATEPQTTTWKFLPGSPGGLLLVEGGVGSAVPWFKPEQLELDLENLAASFGKEPAGGYRVVTEDLKVEQLTTPQLKERLQAKK